MSVRVCANLVTAIIIFRDGAQSPKRWKMLMSYVLIIGVIFSTGRACESVLTKIWSFKKI